MFSLTNLTLQMRLISAPSLAQIHTSAILERARKGTRERKRKEALRNIKLKEERLRKNPPPMPYKIELMLKSKGLWGPPKPVREKDTDLQFPVDNVYFNHDFAYKRHTLEEAIFNLKQVCHPSVMNEPNAIVHAKIEFDMRATKKDRYLDGFSKTVPILKAYDRNVPDRQVVVFVPNEDLRLMALQEGALMAGGHDLIMEISKGQVDIAEVDYFLCHEELSGQVRPLTNSIREKAPSLKNGTIGSDIKRMIQTFSKGMSLEVKKVAAQIGVAEEPDYASCITTIGRLEMSCEDMNENLTVILDTLNENKPKRKDGSGFITRVQLFCLPNDVPDVSKNFMFSIIHPAIYDTRLEEQSKALTQGRAEVAQNVAQLRKNN